MRNLHLTGMDNLHIMDVVLKNTLRLMDIVGKKILCPIGALGRNDFCLMRKNLHLIPIGWKKNLQLMDIVLENNLYLMGIVQWNNLSLIVALGGKNLRLMWKTVHWLGIVKDNPQLVGTSAMGNYLCRSKMNPLIFYLVELINVECLSDERRIALCLPCWSLMRSSVLTACPGSES